MSGTHHFLTDARFSAGPLHRLDPRAKIVGFVGFTVVVVSTPAQAVWAFGGYALILAFLLGLSRLPIGFVLRRALVILPFVLVVAVFLPFFRTAGPGGFSVGPAQVDDAGLLVLWNVLAKGILAVLSVIILGATTSFPELVGGLDGLHVPRIFTLIISFMYRYSFVFMEEFRRMRRAMDARNFRGRWLWQADVVGHMVGALFMRSYSRGERVYLAMLSRGYDGTMHAAAPLRLRAADALFLVGLTAGLFVLRAGVVVWA